MKVNTPAVAIAVVAALLLASLLFARSSQPPVQTSGRAFQAVIELPVASWNVQIMHAQGSGASANFAGESGAIDTWGGLSFYKDGVITAYFPSGGWAGLERINRTL